MNIEETVNINGIYYSLSFLEEVGVLCPDYEIISWNYLGKYVDIFV